MSFKDSLKKKLSEKEENVDKKVEIEEKKAKLQIQSDKLATEQALLNAQEYLDKERIVLPYNPSNIIEAKKDVDKYQKGLDALIALEAEDFPA